ncbi:MAG: glycosyltransferase family 2 protein [Candidatus Blackburnbacteria bacterium]|nr:glycosyltransferase family 2 protein [Candidatus Blackburnbacteria bacterium]
MTLSVVVPVYNEEKDLPRNIPRLHKFLKDNFKDYDWEIIIGDNGPSYDRTAQVSKELVKKNPGIKYVLVPRPGRGGALKRTWLSRKSDILVYMDVDLSSDLQFLSSIVEAIKNGSDIAIGSRLKRGAKVYGRTLTREIMSRGYNLLIKLLFWTSFWDAQCGFKAIKREAAQKLLPYIEDTAWFFDSELLIIADKAGFKITEVPIVWRDDPRSTVKVAKTAWGDIKGLVRLFVTRPWRKLKSGDSLREGKILK